MGTVVTRGCCLHMQVTAVGITEQGKIVSASLDKYALIYVSIVELSMSIFLSMPQILVNLKGSVHLPVERRFENGIGFWLHPVACAFPASFRFGARAKEMLSSHGCAGLYVSGAMAIANPFLKATPALSSAFWSFRLGKSLQGRGIAP